MKIRGAFILAFSFLLAASIPAKGEEPDTPIPVQVGKKFAYRSRDGKEVTPAIYDMACGFSSGLAAVRKDERWGFIDREGKVVIPIEYDAFAPLAAQSRRVPEEFQCGVFTGDVAVAKKRGKWGVIDRSGKFLVEPKYYGFMFAAYRLAPDNTLVSSRDGSWFLSMVEKYVPRIESLGLGPWNLVKQSDVIVSLKDGKVERIFRNTSPERVVPIRQSAGGLRKIMIMGKWGVEDSEGNLVVPAVYQGVGDYSEEMARVKEGEKWGFLDNTGKIAIPVRFVDASDFSDGFAAVRIGNDWGYIDRTGELVIKPQFQFAFPFKEGKARVLQWDGKFVNIDRSGVFLP
jgi:hypothetical protein